MFKSKPNGVTVSQATVQLIFIGNWMGPQIQNIERKVSDVIDFGYFDVLRQYGLSSIRVGGSFLFNKPVPGLTRNPNDPTSLHLVPTQFLASAVASGLLPPPSGAAYSTIYMTFLASNVPGVNPLGNRPALAGAEGYHTPWAPPGQVPSTFATAFYSDRPITIFTHEVAESVTDPDLVSGFRDPNPAYGGENEIGDICHHYPNPYVRYTADTLVSSLWSNADQRCVALYPIYPAADNITVVTGMYLTPQGTHQNGDVNFPFATDTIVSSFADGGNGWVYGNQYFGKSRATLSSPNEPAWVVTDFRVTPENSHLVDSDWDLMPIFGTVADGGNGRLFGNQFFHAKLAYWPSLPAGAQVVLDVYASPENLHIVGGPGCPPSMRQIATVSDYGYGIRFGNQNICVLLGSKP